MTSDPVPAWIERGKQTTRPPIVMLHGIGGGKMQWAAQVELLTDAGWRAIAWDMPGYGESAMPGAEYTFSALAAGLRRLLDALAIERAIVVGHSMGGMVALEAYAQFPERFAGLVLACTSAAFGGTSGEFQRRFVADRLAPLDAGLGMPGMAAQQVPRMMARDAPTSAREAAISIMGAVPEPTYRTALRALATFDRRDVLGLIDVPTLVLAAADDVQAPPEVMEKMASRIVGAEFEVLTGCGHLANIEQPAAFAAAVAGFGLRCAVPRVPRDAQLSGVESGR
ncbi:MAG: alpha/beta fold hydrolase [Casimicrobiaceae bacterium]